MSLLLLALACTTEPAPDTGDAPEASAFVVRLPSAVDGTIRVLRVFSPARARYPEGAPVVVEVPGGWEHGELEALVGGDRRGWVTVELLLPGGSWGDQVAGGSYDHRGPDSVEAVRDALRYAAGELADEHGVLLPERVGVALVPAPTVLVGTSNGGNLALAALAGAADLEVGALVQIEAPVGDQFAGLELNDNPYYEPGTCAPTTCPWRGLAEALALDPAATTAAAGFAEEDTGTWAGRLYLDEDGDGQRGPDEKNFKRLVLGLDDGEERLFPSVELSAALASSGVELPPWVAGPAAVEAFWSTRDGSLSTPAVSAAHPDLLVLLVGTAEDHFQSAEDHPHLVAHAAGWGEHAFVRLNPDAAYLARTSGVEAAHLTECPAGADLTWPALGACLVPEEVDGTSLDVPAVEAAVLEAVDRVVTGERAADLDEPLWELQLDSE